MQRWEVTTLDDLSDVVTSVFKYLEEHTQENAATVLALHGDLGAGKTTFVQMLAATYGIVETVTSPTFVIMKQYAVDHGQTQQFVHIDAYRIEDNSEMVVLGFERLLEQSDTLVCIEWAERIGDLLPVATHHLHFELKGETRMIELKSESL